MPPENKWIPSAEISEKLIGLIKVNLVHPDICKNRHIAQMARFEKCENLRFQEQIKENERL
ncbi:hypothetical protein [Phosphitispora fastidiosa]|uniref:hypothetical protein n=1 Tax=Phosphitispora fastidiosa TaxID=2837202 RepID=UPI001E48F61E|nr:hypothetical protein [Phosphitispora fastidiosa]MBU7006867.1 hypothetical protein [Phosphitispora fastidiosa]